MLKKFFGLWAAILFMVGVAAGVYLLLDSLGGPVMKPVSGVIDSVTGEESQPLVGPYTTVKKVREFLACGDVELYSRGRAEEELVGLDYNRLQMKYPADGGWKITFQNGEVTITRVIDGYCGLHKEYRHLGLHEGKLAVYQGPLGNNEVLLRVEGSIDVNMLPGDWRTRLEKSADFNNLDPDERLDLQETLEFSDEYALNMVLENFDEMDGERGV